VSPVEIAGDSRGRAARLGRDPVRARPARCGAVVLDEKEMRHREPILPDPPDGPVYGGAVLSGWQTVAVSLGAAFLTGSFAILVSWLNVRAQRREQLRVRRVEAASDFSKRFIGASDAVRYAIDHPDDSAAADNAPHLTGEVTPLLGPISLLFRSGSDADQAARAAFEDLRGAGGAVKARDYEAAEERLAESDASRARFEDAVLKVIG
jgi:hypothetical protein